MASDMAIMNPSKLRDVLDLLPYCNLSDTKKKAIEAIITKYLNGDIVPVVRCKDCKYWEKVEYYPDGTKDVCRLLKRQTQDDCFCSYGERKNCGKINARMPEAAGRTSERAVKTNGEDECAGNS